MTADEAIFKMLVQVLKNQAIILRAAPIGHVWLQDFAHHVKETEKLLAKVMEK